MEKELELVKELKETVVEEMEAMKEIKEEVTTKELLKAFGKGAIKGFIGATAITAVTGAIALVIAKKMK